MVHGIYPSIYTVHGIGARRAPVCLLRRVLQPGAHLEMMTDNDVRIVECSTTSHHSRAISSHRHQNGPRSRVLMTYAVYARTPLLTVGAPQSAATAERVDEALAELGAHETVGDGVTAGRDKRQQVDVVHGGRRDVSDGVGVVEDTPRLKYVSTCELEVLLDV